ncbi:TPA_exp: Uncharacterized protein A8136_4354 [Trichophyton benhamiae CBS 112371]|uniref:F-box domain-containing protein n=1 Tax=Arthroderma benhamiae (strain ATCC MYA-4681 / CBS 112371) TaxID=663331 RepID=D4AMX1_ARTBC|nr:uncharacterized protein ARB_05574 [Trichophyton benhamiae CBS 112371]EFE35532.1 hypothetical protein ARB_05574 [Trichophyton benhamiae CBS 112371]DAA78378.1 TPA_exp: Uncharacterized protein A8136_4354 [Trichophyton benhamiae CBS 112371]
MLYSKGAPGIFLLLAKPNFTTRPSVIMRDRDPDTEARVSEAFLQSPSNIFRLMPVSLMQMIIENLHIIDALHFGLTCTDAWCAVWPTLKKFSLSSLGTWAGTPIFCGAEGTMELESIEPPELPTGDRYVRRVNRLLEGRSVDRIRLRRRSALAQMNGQRDGIPDRPTMNPSQPAGLAGGFGVLDAVFNTSSRNRQNVISNRVPNGQRNGLSNGQPNGTSPEGPSQPVMGHMNADMPGRTNGHSIHHGQPNTAPRSRSSERAQQRVNVSYSDLFSTFDGNNPFGNHPSQPHGVAHLHPNGIPSNHRVRADGVVSARQNYRDELRRDQRTRQILLELRNMSNGANRTNETNGTNEVNGTNGVNGVDRVNGNVPVHPSGSGAHRTLTRIESLPIFVHQAWAFFNQTRDVINDCLPTDLLMPANAYIRTGAYYPVDLLTIINPCPASLYRTEPGDEWVLRSLTARQYVRSTTIALHPGYIKGPFIMGIGFGEVVFAMTVWTHTSRGRWAGHSLDIILLSQLEEEDGGNWEDVGDYVRRFIHESFRVHYGEDWEEEAVKLAW